jgi:hypothetical protein
MKTQRFNWPVWAGLLLSLVAILSYPFVFIRWPITRDFPWANLVLFGIAAALVVLGIRRAFAGDRPRRSKIAGAAAATLSLVIFAFFIFAVFVMPRWMPAARGAPQAGQKAPDFSLSDTNGKTVTLSELLTTPIKGKTASANPRGVVLIFYRGYW